MATPFSISNYTPLKFLYFLLLLSSPLSILSINTTDLLSPYLDLSDFTTLLAATSVASDLLNRTSLTILAVSNSHLPHFPSSLDLPDTLRYQILLEYLSWPDIRRIPPSGKLVSTLFETTGRAAANSGTINITFDPISSTVTFHSPTSNATLLSLIKTLPYNVSIISLNTLLIPYNINLMASESRESLGLNITKALIDGHRFNVAASMLAASGVVSELEADETGAGMTILIPTDDVFNDLPPSIKFQSLPADEKAVVLRFHVLPSYYTLGSLQLILNPVQPTLATEQNGAGSFTLNISRVNGSVTINTGIVQASITQTVIDQNPLAIFGVSRVLLPKEFFGKNPIEMNKPPDFTRSPDIALSPVNSPSDHLSAAAPGLEVRSVAENVVVQRIILGLCIVFCFLLL